MSITGSKRFVSGTATAVSDWFDFFPSGDDELATALVFERFFNQRPSDAGTKAAKVKLGTDVAASEFYNVP